MNDQDLDRLRNQLLKNRKEILDRVRRLETDVESLQEIQSELEEEAQKLELSRLYGRLGNQEREEIEAIELALNKLDSGKFGRCEECGEPIPLKRLQVLPWARLCRQDAEEMEKTGRRLPPAREVVISELP
ncbi:MAG: TraR/DksA family transcriptional regulator [Deltaproteobacteria bacterium]|nr:TraR/DksA family transcriptional regulator [Deltaproteobacteria bacterium]